MTGLITSTIRPPAAECYDGHRSRFTPEQRLEQTRGSVGSLAALGCRDMLVADNSAEPPGAEVAALLAPAVVRWLPAAPHRNKGLSELVLLRDALPHLAGTGPVVKLSGRYLLARNLADDLAGGDVAALGHDFRGRRGALVTRAYAVRDAATFARWVRRSLDEAFAYPWRPVGPRALGRILNAWLRPRRDDYPYADPPHSIEFTMARAAKLLRLQVRLLPRLGLRGTMAGTGEAIDE